MWDWFFPTIDIIPFWVVLFRWFFPQLEIVSWMYVLILFSWWMTQGEPSPNLWHPVYSSLYSQILASLNSQPYLFNSGHHQAFFGFPFLHCSPETLQTATTAVIKLTLLVFLLWDYCPESPVVQCLKSVYAFIFSRFQLCKAGGV